jgi:hypothetical protein
VPLSAISLVKVADPEYLTSVPPKIGGQRRLVEYTYSPWHLSPHLGSTGLSMSKLLKEVHVENSNGGSTVHGAIRKRDAAQTNFRPIF